jgi:hypothetical protein
MYITYMTINSLFDRVCRSRWLYGQLKDLTMFWDARRWVYANIYGVMDAVEGGGGSCYFKLTTRIGIKLYKYAGRSTAEL